MPVWLSGLLVHYKENYVILQAIGIKVKKQGW